MVRKSGVDGKKSPTEGNQAPPFPDSIIFEGNTVYYCHKEPNFAEYMLPKAYLNHKIVLNKHEWYRHYVKTQC